jgi:predicted lipoprotein with Yx(FWY)xxD motif
MKISSNLVLIIFLSLILSTNLTRLKYYTYYLSYYPRYTTYSYPYRNNIRNNYNSYTSSTIRTGNNYSGTSVNTNSNSGSSTTSSFTYYSNNNNQPSESDDEDSSNVSSIASTPNYPQKTLQIYTNNQFGKYIVDSKKLTLYVTTKDQSGVGSSPSDFEITCYDTCANDFPPLLVQNENTLYTAGEGLDQAKIGKVKRRDGTWQITFNNAPLYYYKWDDGESDILAHGLEAHGGKWYMVSPDGKKVPTL